MRLIKNIGCPNCTSLESIKGIPLDELKRFSSLKPCRKLSKSRKTVICEECQSEWVIYIGQNLAGLIYRDEKPLIDRFYADDNKISKDHEKILRQIGAPCSSDGFGRFPAKVTTKDGMVYEYAVIKVDDDLWIPHVIEKEKIRFLSDIVTIEPSEQAITLEQRKELDLTPTNKEGVGAIWLIKGDQLVMVTHTDFFLPKKLGRPEEYRILDKNFPNIPWFFKGPEVTLFLGRGSVKFKG